MYSIVNHCDVELMVEHLGVNENYDRKANCNVLFNLECRPIFELQPGDYPN